MSKVQNNPWKQPASQPLGLAQSTLRALGVPNPQPQKFATLRPGEWIDDLLITKQFVAAILQHTETDFVASPGQLQTLADNSARFEEIYAKLAEYSPVKVNERFNAERENIGSQPDNVRLSVRETMQTEALARRKYLKGSLQKITDETTVIAKEICERLQKSALTFAHAREKMERAEAEKFGIEFQPSALLVTAKQATWRFVEDLPDRCLRQSPAQILKTLPIDLPAK